MGNKNAITYKEVFPLLMGNRMWVGYTSLNGGRWMILPKDIDVRSTKAKDDGNGNLILNVAGVCWFANIEHGKRHEMLLLDTMEHNLKYNKALRQKFEKEYGRVEYPHYDNYDAIEVPFVECIPSDYNGVMGVPITFMDKYNPEQFDILGATQRGCHDAFPDTKKYDDYWEVRQNGERTGSSGNKTNENANLRKNDGRSNYFTNAEGDIIQSAYQRLFIRPKKGGNA